ncbi:MAG: transcription termination/antitermination factor NusG [Candidatus Saganbacteria bacterium]|nr:transcription termination/antitermination factor NusG [Candidatus Saganbacteria bacterium]
MTEEKELNLDQGPEEAKQAELPVEPEAQTAEQPAQEPAAEAVSEPAKAEEERQAEEKQPAEQEAPATAEPQAEETEAPAAEPITEVKEETAPEVEEVPAEEAKEPENIGEKKWYVIQTLTGHEDKVKQAIDLTIKSKGLQDKIFQVLVPTEETVEIKGGKRLEKVKKMFPGYVFLEMVLDDESWYLMRETPGVARFIGNKVQPTPVSGREMQRVLKQLGKEEKLLEVHFEKGEGVRVISGPFRGYTGTVDEVNAEKGKLKILINIFGRDTPVEVNFEHAQKIV